MIMSQMYCRRTLCQSRSYVTTSGRYSAWEWAVSVTASYTDRDGWPPMRAISSPLGASRQMYRFR